MNNTTVTFKSDVRTITIDFAHNMENGSLEYKTNIDPPFNEGGTVDLSVVLADKFLRTLAADAETDSSDDVKTEEV